MKIYQNPEMQNMENLFSDFCNSADDFISKQKEEKTVSL
jgi:hypothetical protein